MSAAILGDIVSHARREAPNECCGLLTGTAQTTGTTASSGIEHRCPGSGLHIESSVPARNLRHSPTRYRIDPADHFAAIRAARQRGRRVVGAYHSHPASPPQPSETDDREAWDSEFLYLIVSPENGAARLFRPVGGRLREVELVIMPEPGPDA